MEHNNDPYAKVIFKRIYNTFVFLGVASFILFAYGIGDIDNYTEWFSFISVLLISGLLAGIFLTKAIYHIYPSIIGIMGPSRTPLIFIVSVTAMLLFTGLGRIINEKSPRTTVCSNYYVLETGHSGGGKIGSTPAYYLFVDYHGKKERLSFPKIFALQFKTGDSVELCLSKGNLGFYFFEPYYKQHNEPKTQ